MKHTNTINHTADAIYILAQIGIHLTLALWAILRPLLILTTGAICLLAPFALVEHLTNL